MKTNITQRLIAAGASPERARAFETQFTAARPGAKKKDIQDAFDKELAAASAALFPTTFKPPKASDADFDAYASLVLGQPAIDLAVKRAAPNYTSAERTYAEKDSEDFTFPEFIVNEISRICSSVKHVSGIV